MPPWYRRKGFWNLPNTITVLRCALAPVMVVLLWKVPSPTMALITMIIFVSAMLADILDGWLARRWQLQSVAGAFLDPLADKVMVLTTLVMLIPIGWVPAWAVIVLETRELAISGLRSIAMSEGLVIAAGSLGKFKTAYQSTALGFLLFHYNFMGWVDAYSVGIALLWVSILFSLASAAEYGWGFYVHTRDRAAAARTG